MFFIIIVVLILIFLPIKIIGKSSKKSINGRHVVITGGSSGIGKSVAIVAAKQGANVTIVARNVDKLNEAKAEIETYIKDGQKVTIVSVDVSNRDAVKTNLLELEEIVGPIYMLVNCAGMAICGKLEDMTESDVKQLININVLGTIYSIQAILPKFKERQEGILVITASAVALMGMFGYSIYSSCKFALRGLAESIYMEVKPYNVTVTLAVPPDTDTPGFENENKTKPKETKLMSESAGIFSPEVVAKQLMDDALSSKFFSYVGFESYILTTLCVGMSPFLSVVDLLIQSAVLGPLRLISAYYIKQFEGIVNKCFQERKAQKAND